MPDKKKNDTTKNSRIREKRNVRYKRNTAGLTDNMSDFNKDNSGAEMFLFEMQVFHKPVKKDR